MWKSLKHKASLARQLTVREWLALIEAWWGLLYFHLALRRMSYERLNSSIRVTPGERSGQSGGVEVAERMHRLVGWAARLHILPMTCLMRAFALRWMLARRGIPAQIRIGASKSAAELHAHAWLEVEGQAVGEAEDVGDRFSVLTPK